MNATHYCWEKILRHRVMKDEAGRSAKARAWSITLCCYAWLLSCVWLFETPRTVDSQAPLSMGILQARILEWVATPPPDTLISSVQFNQSVMSELFEFTQTHVHTDAIQPSHPLLTPSPSTFSLSQHQGLFKWVSSSHQVAKVLEFQLQHQSFQWIFRTDFLQEGLVGSPCSPRDSQESSPTGQFKNINSSALSFLYSPTLTSIHV